MRRPVSTVAVALLLLVGCPGPQIVDAGAADGAAVDAAGPQDASTADAFAPPDAHATDAAAGDHADAAPAEDGGVTLQVLASYTDTQHAVLSIGDAIYAVDSANDQVRVFDAVSGAPRSSIAVGRVPGKLATDGTLLFVVNRMARELGEPYVSIVDLATEQVIDTLDVSVKTEGSDPDNYPMTNFPWDACVADGVLYVDFPTNAIPDLRPVTIASRTEAVSWAAGSGPGDLRAAGGKVFVVQGRAISNPDDDALAVYDLAGQLLTTLETGGRLHDLVEAGGKVWVAHAPASGSGDELVVVDVDTLARRSVAVGAGPYGLATHQGRVYVMCQYAGRVDVVDATSEQVVEQIALDGLSPPVVDARGIAVTSSGDLVLEAEGMIGLVRQP
ncbi:MAG: hypothetical protein ABIJ09_23730 [Pseudomonadota bacterium]